MHRYKKIGAVFAGQNGAIPQPDIVVSSTGKLGGIARLFIDHILKNMSHFQDDIFFPRTPWTDGSRIFSTVARINNHDHVALAG